MALGVRAKIASLANPSLRLALAVEKNDAVAVQRELDNGADANFSTRDGATVLMSAVANGHRDAAKALLEAGADPNRVSQFGNTVMDLAADASDADSVMLLLDYGALPSEKLLGRRAEALFGGVPSDTAGDVPVVDEPTIALMVAPAVEEDADSTWDAEREEYETRLAQRSERREKLERAPAGQPATGASAANLKRLLDERADEFQKEQAERKRLEAELAAQRDLIEDMATRHATERDTLQASLKDATAALKRETGQLEVESAARGAAERELSETKAALQAAVESKTQFLAAMGQQIQNHLVAEGGADGAVPSQAGGEDPGDDTKVTPLRRARRGT